MIRQARTQAGELFSAVKRLNPEAPISERVTDDRHGWIFWSDHGLPEMARWLLRHGRREPKARDSAQRGLTNAASSSSRGPA